MCVWNVFVATISVDYLHDIDKRQGSRMRERKAKFVRISAHNLQRNEKREKNTHRIESTNVDIVSLQIDFIIRTKCFRFSHTLHWLDGRARITVSVQCFFCSWRRPAAMWIHQYSNVFFRLFGVRVFSPPKWKTPEKMDENSRHTALTDNHHFAIVLCCF